VVASFADNSLPPGQNLTVTLLITPKEENRRLGGYVIIPLSGAFLKEVRIPVYAEITPAAKP